MKLVGLMLSYLATPMRERNIRLLLALLALLGMLVVIFSGLFHVLMEAEGQQHSWPTAFYWTLVTMTTLGFGDITFKSDAGRIFSIVVLLAGTVFLLILLPFTFIQFLWLPWMARRESERAPRRLPAATRGHLVLTGVGAIEDALIERALFAGVPYVVVVADLDEALRLHDRGYRVMVGALDDPETYRAARIEAAALMVATRPDTTNTNIVFTVQEISATVRILATANTPAAVGILQLAGADEILQLGERLGHALFQRILDVGARTRVLGELAGLHVAEAPLPREGAAAAVAIAREKGVTVVGTWKKGEFRPYDAKEPPTAGEVLVLAGKADQLADYDASHATEAEARGPVVVIGGGRVGRRVGVSLAEAGIPYKIIEKQAVRVRDAAHYVVGDAAKLDVLTAAGLMEAAAVVITTHDDDVNVYLAIYCRRLRPDMQVIARANLDRNVTTLYRAGADAVLSYASTGAAAIWNLLRPEDSLLLAEGLEVFRAKVPPRLAGLTLDQLTVAEETGCCVVAYIPAEPKARCCRDRDLPIAADGELLLIGDDADQDRFRAAYAPQSASWWSPAAGLGRRR